MVRWLVLALVLCAGTVSAGESKILIDDFESGLNPAWTVKKFQGETEYRIVAEGDGHCLQARSKNSASGLVREMKYALKDYPVLSWRWKVDKVLVRGDARTREGDDYAARVYVVFPHWFPPKTRSINYIWANRLPRGSHIPNPFFSNAVMVAVESGAERTGAWVDERRNVLEDYRAIFGEEPPSVGAVAIMTDTDNTGESALACYDDIVISR
jgi:hypothetical protein